MSRLSRHFAAIAAGGVVARGAFARSAGVPRGEYQVLIDFVDAEGNVFTGERVTFYSPGKEVFP